MARKYKRLSYEDRKTIEEMCRNGKKADEIAAAMDVHAVSAVGCVDAVGRVWEWLNDLITRAEHVTNKDYHASEGWGWDLKSPLRDEGTKYDVGNIYQYYAYSLAALIAGGGWGSGVRAGARAVDCYNSPWFVSAGVGVRGACDSL